MVCFLYFLFSCLALALPTASHAQQPPPTEWRAPPPNEAIETMRRSVRMGSDKGHSAKLKGVEIRDQRFKPFLIQITVSGEKRLGIHTAEFTTDGGTFSTSLPPNPNARWDGVALANAPSGTNTKFQAREIEQRTFNIELEQAALLAETTALKVKLFGRLQQRKYQLKTKQLAELKRWLAPRVERYDG